MLRFSAFLAILSIHGDARQHPFPEVSSAFHPIANPHSSESELIQAINCLTVNLSDPQLWQRVANSPQYSVIHRRHCIFQLISRHVKTGCTLGTVARVLGDPTWLRNEDVTTVRTVFGHIPVKLQQNSTVLLIRVLPKPLNCWGVYFRVSGHIPVADFVKLLRGKEVANPVKCSRVLQVGFVPALSRLYGK
jgi:hypothetical protein